MDYFLYFGVVPMHRIKELIMQIAGESFLVLSQKVERHLETVNNIKAVIDITRILIDIVCVRAI
jgi:hypothetical protein